MDDFVNHYNKFTDINSSKNMITKRCAILEMENRFCFTNRDWLMGYRYACMYRGTCLSVCLSVRIDFNENDDTGRRCLCSIRPRDKFNCFVAQATSSARCITRVKHEQKKRSEGQLQEVAKWEQEERLR